MQNLESPLPFPGFSDLCRFRIGRLLLVSTPFDAFILEEDGHLAERIHSEYQCFNLESVPRLTRVSTPEEAFRLIREQSFSLVISMVRVGNMSALDFKTRVHQIDPELPVMFLSYEAVGPGLCEQLRSEGDLSRVFFWSGDARILLAIIESVEDSRNVLHDSEAGVQVILVIEDSYRNYSRFLPLIYTEILRQTRHHIMEGANEFRRAQRMKARPKILLAETFEQGVAVFDTYKQNLLGVISDVRFPRGGVEDPNAGFTFADWVKAEVPDLPVLLTSSEPENRLQALERGLPFLEKSSTDILEGLRAFIQSSFGFGDFVFSMPDGREIARARHLHELASHLRTIPPESLEYHATRNHISIWLRARTEFELALDLRPRKVSDYESLEHLRQDLVSRVHDFMRRKQRGVVRDFVSVWNGEAGIVRMGTGSLGGKARGLAFMDSLLATNRLEEALPEARVWVPNTFVVCTGVFESFLDANGLRRFATGETDDMTIIRAFQRGRLPDELREDLARVLEVLTGPIAVRSSGLLEDCQILPFAGIYRTVMLPNSHPDPVLRLEQLCTAIQLVFASVFSRISKEYVRNTGYRIEDEKMAVVVQDLVGRTRGNLFYPTISGVARSYNYYPYGCMQPEDGVASLALGLGRTVAEGGRVFHYCPANPRVGPPWSSLEEMSHNSQTEFWALDLSNPGRPVPEEALRDLVHVPIARAEADGTLQSIASTLTSEGFIRDTLLIPGARVIRFAQPLKFNTLPLNTVIQALLRLGQASFGTPVEIEFAAEIPERQGEPMDFAILQIRPMNVVQEYREVNLDTIRREETICISTAALGNGYYDDITDLVFVDRKHWNIADTESIAKEISQFNQKLKELGRKYILAGFGRWATSDSSLGIPVQWQQVSNAQVIVEADLPDLWVEPSQGSHFFQNMVSLRLGYLFVRGSDRAGWVDWDWLSDQKEVERTTHVVHLRFEQPLTVEFDGRYSRGVIYKPRKKD